MSEYLHNKNKLEQHKYVEIEQKYTVADPERLAQFRSDAYPVEQFYLSHPEEPYSLRLREDYRSGERTYTATLKDKGIHNPNGLVRREVTAQISHETYTYYNEPHLARLRKLRAEPFPGIVVDFFEDGHTQIENELSQDWEQFIHHAAIEASMIDITSCSTSSNERRAYGLAACELPALPEQLSVAGIIDDIVTQRSPSQPFTISVNGRSGSGKSTVVTALCKQLEDIGLSTAVISTDNYNRGKTWLDTWRGEPWTNWDHPLVYDTKQAAHDLIQLQNGQEIDHRLFDFATQAPSISGTIRPAPVIVVEGIYARSPHLSPHINLRYEQPTPLATCIGRRLDRDYFSGERANDSLARPEEILRYLLEVAEPSYRADI